MKYLLLVTSLFLSGCGAMQPSSAPNPMQNASCPSRLSSDQELKLSMISQQIVDGKQYAALAGLSELPSSSPVVMRKKADVLRRIASPDAKSLYMDLQKTCLSAYGDHGLGLLYASEKDFPKARALIERAAKKVPTDEAIRNDLGLTYLYEGNYERSRFELMTAIELNSSFSRAVTNLAALLILRADIQSLTTLNDRFSLNVEQVSQSMELCSQIKSYHLASADLAKSKTDLVVQSADPQCSWHSIAHVPKLASLFRTHQ